MHESASDSAEPGAGRQELTLLTTHLGISQQSVFLYEGHAANMVRQRPRSDAAPPADVSHALASPATAGTNAGSQVVKAQGLLSELQIVEATDTLLRILLQQQRYQLDCKVKEPVP